MKKASMKVEELEQFKRQLLDLRARLTGEVDHLIDAIPDETNSSGNLSNVPMHLGDMADSGTDVDIDLLHNEQDLLSAVEEALVRTENGTYGTCQNCGQPIAILRLEAIPYAPYCIECASKLQNQPS